MQRTFKIQKRKRKASTSTPARKRLPTWIRNLLPGGRLLRLERQDASALEATTAEPAKRSIQNVKKPITSSEDDNSLCMLSIEAALPDTTQAMASTLPLAPSAHHLPPYMINMLHHSASNTDTPPSTSPPPLEVELRYPSSYTERFILTPKTQSNRKDRHLTPISDLITTITLLLHASTGPIGPHTKLCPLLLQTYETHNISLFTSTLATLTTHLSAPAPPLRKPSQAIIHHFFAQLYDRAISPYSRHLDSRRSPGTTNSVYGELQPKFLSRIFAQTNLREGQTYIDLGSGVGNTTMQAALETGCDAHGIERENYAHLVSALHLQQFHIRCMLWGLKPGKVHLYHADFLHSPNLTNHLLPEADVVVVNNFKFEPETDLGLLGLLEQGLKKGARVVSMRPVVVGRLRSPRRDGEDEEVWRVEECVYEEDSVSWSGARGSYWVSTKMR